MNNQDDSIILELFDEAKQSHKYELLDIVNYKGKEYVVLLPTDPEDNEVEIFQTTHSEGYTETTYIPEKNDYIIMQVYNMFKEKFKKYYSDRIVFEDD